jgi:hypothetical protein
MFSNLLLSHLICFFRKNSTLLSEFDGLSFRQPDPKSSSGNGHDDVEVDQILDLSSIDSSAANGHDQVRTKYSLVLIRSVFPIKTDNTLEII